MHTVEILKQAIDLAKRLDYTVRQEWFAGAGGGCCELKGQKYLFVDLDLDPRDQLEQVLEAIRQEPDAEKLSMSEDLLARVHRKSCAFDGVVVR